MKKLTAAILGATGIVGKTLVDALYEFTLFYYIDELILFASEKSENLVLTFKGLRIAVRTLSEQAVNQLKADVAFVCLNEQLSGRFTPLLAKNGILVIDNSSAFRLDPNVPLVVPEINPNIAFKHNGIIANPNCTTVQTALALYPLHKLFNLKELIISTYQAVSGAGVQAVDELHNPRSSPLALPYPICSNTIPFIGQIDQEGNCTEENKLKSELAKILDIPTLKVAATTVRIPVENCHGVALHAEFQNPFTLEAAKAALINQSGIRLCDSPPPMPLTQAHKNDVAIGRLRKSFRPNALDMWVVADNLRKGAATNAIQIAQLLLINQKL